MENIHSIRLRRLQGQLGDVVYQMTKVQFSRFSPPETWQPALNAYRCENCVIICVDLAGVDRDEIQLEVTPTRLSLRGQRRPPEPESHKPVQILAMEIDYGRFERVVTLPSDTQPDKITAEQRNGLLWIYLPLRCHG